MIFTWYPNDFWDKRKNYNSDSYNVLLAIAANILMLLMTGFVVQGHICALNVIVHIPDHSRSEEWAEGGLSLRFQYFTVQMFHVQPMSPLKTDNKMLCHACNCRASLFSCWGWGWWKICTKSHWLSVLALEITGVLLIKTGGNPGNANLKTSHVIKKWI